jgi:hypothetical protein
VEMVNCSLDILKLSCMLLPRIKSLWLCEMIWSRRGTSQVSKDLGKKLGNGVHDAYGAVVSNCQRIISFFQ